MAPGRIYDIGEALSGLVNLLLRDYTGSRVNCIGEWFEQLRLLNEYATPGNGLGYDFAKSMLLKAIDSDDKLPDAFTELDCTGNLTVNMEEYKLHMINKASLYDGKDNFLKRGKKKISINHLSNSLTHILKKNS